MQHLPLSITSALQHARCPETLLKSFQKYLSTPYQSEGAHYDSMELDECSRIRIYAAKEAHISLCLIPSLINGPEIFDITADYSFIRFMQQSGVTIYLLDWGDLSNASALSLDALVKEKMRSFWQQVNSHTKSPPHIMGYCLGGTLLASFMAQYRGSKTPASLSFLTTPFDFQASESAWEKVLRAPNKILQQIKAQNGLTSGMLQSYFLHLNPAYTEQKFASFLQLKENSAEEKRFIAVERWLHTGPDLPRQLAQDIIERYFIQNSALQVLSRLPMLNTCLLQSKTDQIVAQKSSNILQEYVPNLHRIDSSCGHVGMMTSVRAKETVWQPYLKYMNSIASQQG